MTFLNPAVLVGLIAAAFPLLLHIFNLRKLRVIEFSTVSFLQELQKSTLRRLKFQYWLLLILRTLLILFIVLAFARPVLRGTFSMGSGGHSATTMIIILDDSYSMGRTDEHGILLSQAQARANELLSMLREGDDGLVLKLSGGGKTPFDAPTQNTTLLKAIVRETKLSAVYRPIDDALRASARLLQHSTNPNKEIFILSDMQRGTIQPQSDSSTIRTLFNNNVKIFFSTFGGSSKNNAGIIDTRIENTLFDLDRPCIVSATVKNFGLTPLHTFVVSAYLGKARVQQKSIDLAPQQSATIEFPLLLQHRGLNDGSIRIEDDQCEYDNIRYFSVNIPQTIRILLVAQSPEDFTFVRTALEISQSAAHSSIFSTTSSTWNGVTSTNLRDMNVVISSISNEPSADALQRLKEYTKSGGTLILFPGKNIFPASLHRLASALNLSGVDSINGNMQERERFRTLEHVDDRHPIFNGMFESHEHDRASGARPRNEIQLSDAPRVFQSVVIHPVSRSNTLIALSDGNGFLTEYPSGEGKILFYAVPPTAEWSEFPLKGLFVPLLYRTILYGAQVAVPINAAFCGDPITFSIPSLLSGDQMPWSVVAPDGDETRVKPLLNSGRHSSTVTDSTSLNGLYTIMHGISPYAQCAVNMDPKESDLTPLDEPAFRSHIIAYGISDNRIVGIDPTKSAQAMILESRYGQELWRFAMICALACAFFEMLVTYSSKRYAQREPL